MSEIEVRREGNVAVVTLSAPNRRNALTREMAEELIEACDEIDSDASLGAAVVRGEGGNFCSGAHRALLAEAASDPAHPEAYDAISTVYGAFVRVGSLRVPTIAAVRGAAVGAGVNLMLATDLRVVASDARILSGFLRIGVHPGGGHFSLVGRAAGREAASALGIFGAEIDGRRAVALGLAWEDVSDDEVEPRAIELATGVAGDPDLARAATASLREQLGPPMVTWPVGVQAERARQMWSFRRNAERP